MLMRYMPCGQLDLDDSFLQHIFNWCLCEVQLHYLSGLSFKYVQDNYIAKHSSFSLVTVYHRYCLGNWIVILIPIFLILFFQQMVPLLVI